MLDASYWNLKVEIMIETPYIKFYDNKRKVTNKKKLLVYLMVNLITKYQKVF